MPSATPSLHHSSNISPSMVIDDGRRHRYLTTADGVATSRRGSRALSSTSLTELPLHPFHPKQAQAQACAPMQPPLAHLWLGRWRQGTFCAQATARPFYPYRRPPAWNAKARSQRRELRKAALYHA
ncbi:hypothetical protein WOLCODRAFT_167228 [Wolfiporia cocos MD-104 SS10]|uniref:Uncharacterized protein n=1 Tax=Wolfiporia cocos (strain MD-104) TaxID=742152 RepID=A0A2H3J430_WOLCO|nr:hypothetical protein WOLCODRAFT_167228 [Wolfiporia cocos MD-104 SS10]